MLGAGLVSDWRPLADVPLNYPLGSRAWSRCLPAAAGSARAFSLLLASTGVVMTAQVTYLTRRATGDIAAGTWAAMAFAF